MDKEIFGDWNAEVDKSDLILLAEGADFPDGYEPYYRDKSTFRLVMKRSC